MSKKFKFKLEKKSVKLNIRSIVEKLTLKFIGLYGNKKIKFTTSVSIKFDQSGKIKKINISELDTDIFSDNNSKNKYLKSYLLCPSNSSNSSSSSSCSYSSNIYNEIKSFINNIKIISDNEKLSSIIFSLKNTNIKKIKVKGKLN